MCLLFYFPLNVQNRESVISHRCCRCPPRFLCPGNSCANREHRFSSLSIKQLLHHSTNLKVTEKVSQTSFDFRWTVGTDYKCCNYCPRRGWVDGEGGTQPARRREHTPTPLLLPPQPYPPARTGYTAGVTPLAPRCNESQGERALLCRVQWHRQAGPVTGLPLNRQGPGTRD